jgi:hypothetical protein
MQLIDRDMPGPKRDFVGYGRQLPKVFWLHEGFGKELCKISGEFSCCSLRGAG